MKQLSAPFLAHLAQATTTLAEGWRIIRTDGTTYGFTSHDVPVVIEDVTYAAAPGLRASAAHTTENLAVDTLDVSLLLTVSDEEAIHAGLWDDAQVTVFLYNWAAPPTALGDQVLILRHGTLGEVQRQQNRLQAEIRGLVERLAVRTGRQYSPTCPWRHAQWTGSTYLAGIECQADLSGRIHTGTITGVGADPTREFSDSGQAQAEGYFNEGFVTCTSGDNAGVTREVRAWAGGQFSLYFPFAYPVAEGDTYSAVQGDDHRYETCRDTYTNVVNFGGDPFLPGIDKVYSNVLGL